MSINTLSFSIQQHGTQRRIRYEGLDHLGGRHTYGPIMTEDGTFDPAARSESIRLKLERLAARAEVETWLDGVGTVPIFVHAVAPQYLSTWRTVFKDSKREESLRLAYHMKTAIDRGDFTNPQMNNAWNITDPQRIAFMSRLETRRLVYVDVLNEESE